MRYTLVDFNDDNALDLHLDLAGVDQTQENRQTLRHMGSELKLLLGKDRIRHLELQAYINQRQNIVRLLF